MEYGNGIMGDMCIHMLDMVRWMLGLGWPKSISSAGGILVAEGRQLEHFRHAVGDVRLRRACRWSGSTAPGATRWTRSTRGPRPSTATRARSRPACIRYEFTPVGKKAPSLSGTPLLEFDKYPEDKTEKDLEKHVASALRWHWKDFLKARETRGKPVADIEQGHISTASCILANLSMDLGRSLAWDGEKQQVVGDAEANARLAAPTAPRGCIRSQRERRAKR